MKINQDLHKIQILPYLGSIDKLNDKNYTKMSQKWCQKRNLTAKNNDKIGINKVEDVNKDKVKSPHIDLFVEG